jgi:hypothetical protein
MVTGDGNFLENCSGFLVQGDNSRVLESHEGGSFGTSHRIDNSYHVLAVGSEDNIFDAESMIAVGVSNIANRMLHGAVMGFGLRAERRNVIVMGVLNKMEEDAMVVVGCGKSSEDRRNAMIIDYNCTTTVEDLVVKGSITVDSIQMGHHLIQPDTLSALEKRIKDLEDRLNELERLNAK